ncbi:hypothetical protein KC460_01960 [Candidatus Dependentiae bacterium]|nr:hypothetical protein [Candidatus Dependentiae bacterium]
MKTIFDNKKVRQYWKRTMESSKRAMSRGASNISKIISWARCENWRGRKENKK